MTSFLKKIIYFTTINIMLILNSFQNNAECNDFVIKFEIKTKDLIKNKINNIFELTDEFGKKIISIVHLSTWQTTRSSNPYGIIFSVHPEFLEEAIEEHFIYDNPFKHSTGTGLMVQDECLYSYPINSTLNENNVLLKYDINQNKFFSLDEIQFNPYYTFSNDTILSGDRKNIKFTNFPDLKESLSGEIGKYLLSGNFICLDFIVDKESDPDGIGFVALKMYKFSTDENKWNFLHLSRLKNKNDFLYCISCQLNEFILCTSYGWIYKASENGIECIGTNYDGISNQLYCALKFNDETLYGHYPSGHIHLITDTQQIDTMEPPILNPVWPNERELMAMSIYAGSVYTGIWPWGEVYKKNINTSVWAQAMRCFDKPDFNQFNEAPYKDVIEANGLNFVYNEFGQRVYHIVPYDEYLFLSTCGKSSCPRDLWKNAEDHINLDEYGKIHSIKINGQYTLYIKASSKFTLIKIEILNSLQKINIYIDKILIKTLENCVVKIPDKYNYQFFDESRIRS